MSIIKTIAAAIAFAVLLIACAMGLSWLADHAVQLMRAAFDGNAAARIVIGVLSGVSITLLMLGLVAPFYIRRYFGFPTAWLLYWIGHGLSLLMQRDAFAFLYPAYNRAMLWSAGICDWAGGAGGRWPWGPKEPVPNTVSVDSLVKEFEADPQMAEHLREARITVEGKPARPAGTVQDQDAARFVWWMSGQKPANYIDELLRGIREGWTLDQWREWIDAARAGDGQGAGG